MTSGARFSRTCGFKVRRRLDIVSTKQAKTAGRFPGGNPARHLTTVNQHSLAGVITLPDTDGSLTPSHRREVS